LSGLLAYSLPPCFVRNISKIINISKEEIHRLLTAAGFEQVAIEVQQRYTAGEMLSDTPEALSALPSEVVNNLVSRFTSSITARRPSQ
jgi:hypothetical protein